MGQLLGIFLNVLTPVFALVALGYLVGPRLGLQARTLSRIAYYLLMPGFVFSALGTAHIDFALAGRVLGYILTAQAGIVLIGFLAARLLRRPPTYIAAYILVVTFPNVGNFGIAIIRFALGEAATTLATIYFVAISATSFAIGVAAANFVRGGSLVALTAALKTPAVLSVIPALTLNFLNIPLPPVVLRPLDLLGSAMIPVMLLGLGVQFADSGLPKLNLDMLVASGIRLLAAPALAALLAIPFGISGPEKAAGVIQTSTPTAVFAAIIAMEHDLVPEFVTATVILSTLLSLPTMALVLYLLGIH